MIETKTYNVNKKPEKKEKEQIIDFLKEHLDEFGDPRADIEKAVNYALKEGESFGGFLLTATKNEQLIGSVVVNRTGMNGYIPDNILVYIATHRNFRGQGIGKQLMQLALKTAKGDVALHVEPNNPARYLYEKIGFTNKYLEMRYKQKAI